MTSTFLYVRRECCSRICPNRNNDWIPLSEVPASGQPEVVKCPRCGGSDMKNVERMLPRDFPGYKPTKLKNSKFWLLVPEGEVPTIPPVPTRSVVAEREEEDAVVRSRITRIDVFHCFEEDSGAWTSHIHTSDPSSACQQIFTVDLKGLELLLFDVLDEDFSLLQSAKIYETNKEEPLTIPARAKVRRQGVFSHVKNLRNEKDRYITWSQVKANGKEWPGITLSFEKPVGERLGIDGKVFLTYPSGQWCYRDTAVDGTVICPLNAYAL